MNDKKRAAKRALDFVSNGMVLGLGTGSTMGYFIDLLGEALGRGILHDIQCVPTSNASAAQAQEVGIALTSLSEKSKLDLAIDGADEVDPNLDLIKGMGGALLREKVVEVYADRFLVIVDEGKIVSKLGMRVPLPVEILPFGLQAHISWLESLDCQPELVSLNEGAPFITDNGNYLAHCRFPYGIDDPFELARKLADQPGIIEHGLFLRMADTVIIAGSTGIQILERES